jgi:enoyl-CoA hydratase
VRDWCDLADAVTAAGRDPQTAAVILLAAGRGLCAGVDIKELQREGHDAVIEDLATAREVIEGVVREACEVPLRLGAVGAC